MAYDEELAARIRTALGEQPNLREQRMFGGLGFMINGNMAIAASGQGGALVRADPDESDALLARPGAGLFEMRGKPMQGWLRVDDAHLAAEDELAYWVDVGRRAALALPPK
jgi:hypothetical protein